MNNLLQGPFFTAADLADIAHQLDAREREVMLSQGTETADAIRFLAADSVNIDESGNFSITVLREAVRRSHGVELVARGSDVDKALEDPTAEAAFLLNLSSHWFTVRRLYGKWFNLNSFLKHPQVISPFYLSVFLAQMRAEGYCIFLVRGALPSPLRDCTMGNPTSWHTVEKLLAAGPASAVPSSPAAGSRDGSATPDAALAVALAASLADGGGPAGATNAGAGSGVADDDVALAIALSMSRSDGGAAAGAGASVPSAVAAAADDDDDDSDDDDAADDLARAIAMSQATAASASAAAAAAAAPHSPVPRLAPAPTSAPPVAAPLPAEPAADATDAVRVQVRLPSGAAVQRRFAGATPAAVVLQWAGGALPTAPAASGFRLVSTHPPVTLAPGAASSAATLTELNLAPSVSFNVATG